jgi:hypothetical protein
MDIKRRVIGVNKPLIIIFNSNIYDCSKFELEKSLENYECNFIFLRDKYLSWYINGIDGFSKSLEETKNKLQEEIEQIKPNKVITIGLSSGGFAALYFGNLLKVAHIIACSPQIIVNNNTIKYYYNKLKKIDKEISILPLDENINIDIFWCNFDDFIGVTKKQNPYVEQNRNDEQQYELVKNIKNINNIQVKGGNHGDIMIIIIKNGELFKLINKIIE